MKHEGTTLRLQHVQQGILMEMHSSGLWGWPRISLAWALTQCFWKHVSCSNESCEVITMPVCWSESLNTHDGAKTLIQKPPGHYHPWRRHPLPCPNSPCMRAELSKLFLHWLYFHLKPLVCHSLVNHLLGTYSVWCYSGHWRLRKRAEKSLSPGLGFLHAWGQGLVLWVLCAGVMMSFLLTFYLYFNSFFFIYFRTNA